MKFLEKAFEALACCEISIVSGQDIKTVIEGVTTIRKQARLQISCRTALVLLQLRKVEDVEKFFSECKGLKVTLPPELKQRLEALKAGALAEPAVAR